jgi:hypothetical protein
VVLRPTSPDLEHLRSPQLEGAPSIRTPASAYEHHRHPLAVAVGTALDVLEVVADLDQRSLEALEDDDPGMTEDVVLLHDADH